MGSGDCGERDLGKKTGENDGVRVLWGTGYGEHTVARMMGSGYCGERDMGQILWRESWGQGTMGNGKQEGDCRIGIEEGTVGKGMGGGRDCGERDAGRDSREREVGRGLWGKG